jgi:hypothetical protein
MRYELTFRAAPSGPFPPERRTPGRNGAPDSPIRADFPDGPEGGRAYLVAWYAWRRQIEDGHLTRAEESVRADLYAKIFEVPKDVARIMNLAQLRHLSTLDPYVRSLFLAALLEQPLPRRDQATA